MVGQIFVKLLQSRRVQGLVTLPDATVKLLLLAIEDRVVRSLLSQGVLKAVFDLRYDPLLVDDLFLF